MPLDAGGAPFRRGVGGAAFTTAAATSTSTTYAAVTGLSVPLLASSVYRILARGTYQSSVITTGIGLQLNGTATVQTPGLRAGIVIWGVTATTASQAVQANLGGGVAKTTGVAAANTSYPWLIDGLIRTLAAGTLTIELASEIALTTVTLDPLAFLRVERLA